MTSLSAPAVAPVERRRPDTSLRTLQVGMHWFPERPGGLDRVYFDLWRHLPACGVGFRGMVAGSASVAHETGQAVEAFAPAEAPLPERALAARRLIRQHLRDDPALLPAIHFPLYAAPALDLLRRRPVVLHFHGPWALEARVEHGISGAGTAMRRQLERAVYGRATLAITLSRAFAELLASEYGVAPERIRVVPGGVETDRFADVPCPVTARERLGWPQDRPIVLAVRRLVRRMGLVELIAAAALLRRRMPDLLVMVAGGGPMEHELRQRIAAHGLGEQVRLVGRLPDEQLPLAYRAADLTVVPSRALEGFGLVVAESLAAGTPALVAPVGGLPEVVRPLAPDLVLPSTEPQVLADHLHAALTGALPLPSGEACRRHVRAHHDWRVIAGRVRSVYEEALR